MFLSVHATVAITSINYTQNPILLFLINFFLHYLLDAIPHGDGDNIKGFKNPIINLAILSFLDLFFVLIILYFSHNNLKYNYNTLIPAIIGAILPDYLWGLYKITNLKILKWANDINELSHKIIKYKPHYLIEYGLQFIPIIICYIILKY
ncbi:MAG: hypothetical protein PHZ07_04345 [Patescibacteria group bacterium]|nr:hypothetical protein [Patescibacteria group bacterium]MDD4304729.1 hypothetical protein [Patescibacteria group bacterium]MDD4695516.1 hypothetical protein [Patescibacteria group bacterium]